MSLYWYNKYWKKYELVKFNSWYIEFYGTPTAYSSEQSEQDEYWLRKGFALMGWLAALKDIKI